MVSFGAGSQVHFCTGLESGSSGIRYRPMTRFRFGGGPGFKVGSTKLSNEEAVCSAAQESLHRASQP